MAFTFTARLLGKTLGKTLGMAVCLAHLLSACGGSSAPEAAQPLPATSGPVAASNTALSLGLDQLIAGFMTAKGVSALSLAVIGKDGRVVHDKGYGYLDATQQRALPADALMVTASVVKPVTAAAIQQLAALGRLSLSDHVFCSGRNAPCWLSADLLSADTDPRVQDISIAHLIAHQAGWDRRLHNGLDLDHLEAQVQQSLGLNTPPSSDDDLRYWLRRPLDFTPGTQTAYSSTSYMLLGRIVERASQQDYVGFVQAQLLKPLGVSADDFKLANSPLSQRDAREPNYLTGQSAPSIYQPGKTVSAQDGTLNGSNWVAAVSSLTTARALALFASRYTLQTSASGVDMAGNGLPLAGQTHDGFHFGELPGTTSIIRQLPSGSSYAVLMNKAEEQASDSYHVALMAQIDAALAASGF
ncbi:beta-lactamase family protein [Paucibacter sp. B2R-40]|uniref:serine hydrolase domain-containing protein n=1 Tax=Paucibacter sp. B2R-40 TaxID=2893554 RepID=UPI0021E50D39|nr:serine hydrolase domain-containing protein [Paucibacter sp. B2R-40]MCV2354840.1 beta-lactamase family protein [Paucibacter sp. B2R-40]